MAKAIIHGPTYRNIFGKVQSGEVDAALVNSEVYVAYQSEYRDPSRYHYIKLHVVQEFEMNQDVWIATKFNDDSTEDPPKSQQQHDMRSSKFNDARPDGSDSSKCGSSSTPTTDGRRNRESSSSAAARLYRCMTVDKEHLIFRVPVMQEPSQVRVDSRGVSGLFQTVCVYLCIAILVVFSICVSCRMWELYKNQQQRIDNRSTIIMKYQNSDSVGNVNHRNNIPFSESIID